MVKNNYLLPFILDMIENIDVGAVDGGLIISCSFLFLFYFSFFIILFLGKLRNSGSVMSHVTKCHTSVTVMIT